MKKIVLFIALAASLGNCLQAQDTLWMKPAPLGNYYYNDWLDTTTRYATAWESMPVDVIAKRFVTKDTLQVYGIAAMMTHPNAFLFIPSDRFPTLQDYLNYKYPRNPTLDNCEEKLLLYQYHGSGPTSMQLMGDSLSVQYYDVTHWMMSNTSPISYFDTFPKPVYERYYPEPQTVYDTFYAGYTQSYFEFVESYDDILRDTYFIPKFWRPEFYCFYFTTASNHNILDYEEHMAWLRRESPYLPATWDFRPGDSLGTLFIFPIIAPPDTTVNPGDTVINSGDTVFTGEVILHSGNTVIVPPGSTLVIGGDTLVNTGDTLTITLGDTIVIGGNTFVLNPGDTLFVSSGGFLIVNPDGTIVIGSGSTVVVNTGSGDDPGVGLRQTDMLYRYTAVSPNPATGKVRITSSFGLTQINVYDTKGRLLRTLPATGLKADLDVSSWPSGTYLLRITTPVGSTTKKLLIR
ncbi:MAG: T9SS type A sorting domain-containing protein [Bacteroidales bacterium]|nr:T9SS type A sorting domain-containing protein [Bacteroidales bacterium]